MLPGESAPDFQDQYDRLLEKTTADVGRGIIEGNMLAYGGPASARMADLVVASFKNVPPGTVKGVREFIRTLPNVGLAFQMADNLVPQDKIGVVLATAKWRNQEATAEQIKTLAKYRKDMRAKFPDYPAFAAWVKKQYTKGDVSRLLDEVFGRKRRA
jgi:hypothetical protein